MTSSFHRCLNRMALFTAVLVAVLILFYAPFMQIACANIYLNGVIIGTTIFGIGLTFWNMFRLLPEYRWMCAFFANKPANLPPMLLRPVAMLLRARPRALPASLLQSMLDMIVMRMDDSRESVRYITNTLIFLGFLGTFWGLILTVGGFAELVGGLDFSDASVMDAMQAGLARPLNGMATAFTSSLIGLGGSLAVGFLGLQMQLAQTSMLHELEEDLSARAIIDDACAN